MHLHISQHTFTPFHSHSPTHAPSHLTAYIHTLSQSQPHTSPSMHPHISQHTFTVTAPHMRPRTSPSTSHATPFPHTHTEQGTSPCGRGATQAEHKGHRWKERMEKVLFHCESVIFHTSCYDNVKILLPLENNTPQYSVKSTFPSIQFYFSDLERDSTVPLSNFMFLPKH